MQRRILWIACVAICAATSGCGGKPAGAEGAADKRTDAHDAVPVRLEAAQVRTIAETVEGWGRCEALPDQIASLTPAVEGRVAKILVKLGDGVRQGQPIVQLETRIAEANLKDKEAARDGFQATLNLLQTPPREEELKSQELAIEQAQVAMEKAKTTVDRLKPLAGGQVSGTQLLEAENALQLAILQKKTAEAQLKVLKLGPRPEAVKEAESKIATAQANVDTANAQLKLDTLESPIDGTLDNLSCRLGQTLTVGMPVGEIVNTKSLYVVIWLSSRDVGRIQTGQAATVQATLASANRETKSAADEDQLPGTVATIGNTADPQTGNFPVRLRIDNPDGRLRIGQMTAATIILREKADVLAIPKVALFDAGQGVMFNIVREGKSARVRPELGLRDREWVEVIDTDLSEKLKDGEAIIVDGGYNLPEGNKVYVPAGDGAKK